MGELSTVSKIMRSKGTPRKFAIIATIMQCRRTRRRRYDRQICLVHGTTVLGHQSSNFKTERGETTAYPSRRQDATKIASASASLSISHSPGRSEWWRGDMSPSRLAAAGSDATRTPAPNTRMTTSCARELISFARRTRWTSASDLVRRARCKAERRYASDDDEL